MKAIMIMFDSLNRHFLPPYGCDWTHAPNFARLAARALTFERAYVASMPCMPARRDLHTGRPHFLQRDWGPLEPFDDSMPQMLRAAGVYTHLATDHQHYFEEGGATYHTRYNSWQFFRGQEGDPWIGQVADPSPVEMLRRSVADGGLVRQDRVNRAFLTGADLPQVQTFNAGLDFIERNAQEDNWFLQIETFDPHEPFFAPQFYKDLYPHSYEGPEFDWPVYAPVTETPEAVEHCRLEYAALLSMCDAQLGRVLDAMDEHNLWEDTLLMVWTDHGFLLGEHGCWAKSWMPLYEEISHTPFWIYDPRSAHAGERRQSLVQPALDLAPTLLEFFGVEPTPDMIGYGLRPTIETDAPVREAAIFGYFGQGVNVTDGRHVYLRDAVANGPLWEYTLMPTRMSQPFSLQILAEATLAPPLAFSKGCPLLRVNRASNEARAPDQIRHLLFDLQSDPAQQTPLHAPAIEATMISHLRRLMHESAAPPEQFERLGLDS